MKIKLKIKLIVFKLRWLRESSYGLASLPSPGGSVNFLVERKQKSKKKKTKKKDDKQGAVDKREDKRKTIDQAIHKKRNKIKKFWYVTQTKPKVYLKLMLLCFFFVCVSICLYREDGGLLWLKKLGFVFTLVWRIFSKKKNKKKKRIWKKICCCFRRHKCVYIKMPAICVSFHLVFAANEKNSLFRNASSPF